MEQVISHYDLIYIHHLLLLKADTTFLSLSIQTTQEVAKQVIFKILWLIKQLIETVSYSMQII